MKQKADGTVSGLRRETLDAHGEQREKVNDSPATLTQNSAVCLPLVSDSQKLLWVHSSQIDLELDGAAELDKAFDRFPYLTQKQTNALARRCSLDPDQVKVWFMAQRLRYGISWDYKDINKIWWELNGKEKQTKTGEAATAERGENIKCKKKGKAFGGKKASEGEIGVMGGNGRQVTTEKVRSVEEGKGRTQKKRVTMTDKMGTKRMKRGDEGVEEKEMETKLEGEPHAHSRRVWIRRGPKTRTQVARLRVAFTHCQYPNSEDYRQLAMSIDLPRCTLVQWFGDMRYYIKKAKPGWMNEEQHSQALANVKYRQFLNTIGEKSKIKSTVKLGQSGEDVNNPSELN